MKAFETTKDTCFALRTNDEYYVARGECYALKWPDYKKMRITNKCNTMACPFYKPKRSMRRCGNVIKSKHGSVVMCKED